VDWWSVGVLAHEIVTGRTPFDTEKDDDTKVYK
jgi:serine/threonine protein kinase